jgi:hypothetical protein
MKFILRVRCFCWWLFSVSHCRLNKANMLKRGEREFTVPASFLPSSFFLSTNPLPSRIEISKRILHITSQVLTSELLFRAQLPNDMLRTNFDFLCRHPTFEMKAAPQMAVSSSEDAALADQVAKTTIPKDRFAEFVSCFDIAKSV